MSHVIITDKQLIHENLIYQRVGAKLVLYNPLGKQTITGEVLQEVLKKLCVTVNQTKYQSHVVATLDARPVSQLELFINEWGSERVVKTEGDDIWIRFGSHGDYTKQEDWNTDEPALAQEFGDDNFYTYHAFRPMKNGEHYVRANVLAEKDAEIAKWKLEAANVSLALLKCSTRNVDYIETLENVLSALLTADLTPEERQHHVGKINKILREGKS